VDAQGFGQSDGARGYFENFEDLVTDFTEFCKVKWMEVVDKQSKAHGGRTPGLVFLGKGFGALVVMHTLIELHPLMCEWGVMPSVILVSPAFQFSSYIGDQTGASCGLAGMPTSGQCARQPAAQCARVPAAAVPMTVTFSPNDDGPTARLEHMSRWFPKMITTQPVDPELVSRDPQTVERMTRDVLCWHSGYRARVLAEIAREMSDMVENVSLHPDVFERIPALILHGSGDGLFSVTGSHSVHSAWCDAAQRSGNYPRLKIYDGAFHQLLNEPNKEEVVNDIVMFVASKALH
jgi:alpha-beta hydrolase superfamily lysophospholipase